MLEFKTDLSPNEIKSIITNEACSLGEEANAEGCGLVDASRCVYSIRNNKNSLNSCY